MSSRASDGTSGPSTGRKKRTEIARLCATLFGSTPLAPFCQTWATENARFAAFLDTYQDKIGKKLRGIRDEAGFFDLLAELDIAYRLLVERSFALIYEPYLADKRRGPDFAVTFKTHMLCNIEARHLQLSSSEPGPRLTAIFADKLRQLPPSVPNVLALSGATGITAPQQIQDALQALAALTSQRDGDDINRGERGFASARDLSRHLERLSAVAILAPPPAFLWEHPRARHPLAPELRKALARALGVYEAM